MRKLSVNTITSLLAQIISLVCSLMLPRIILEAFGSEVNGLTQSIKQFLGIINFLEMGVGQVVKSSLYGPLSSNDNTQISRILSSAREFFRKIAFTLLLYVIALMLFYPPIVAESFSTYYTASLIFILAIGSFVQYYFGVTNEILLHADQRSYLTYGIQIVSNLLNLAICIGMIYMNCSIHAVKLGTAIAFAIKPCVYAIYMRHHYSIDSKIEYTEEPIKQKWNGVAQHASAVVLDGTDNIILTLFSTLSNVSVYSVYYMIIANIQNLFQAAITGVHAAAGAIWALQDQNKIEKLFFSVEFVIHTAITFLFSCTVVLIVPFVSVYTNGLTDVDYIQPLFSVILVAAYGIRCLRSPYNIWIMAAGHFKQTQHCHIIAAVLNLTLSIIAVSRWGLVGIAIGTFIAMCYQTIWMAIYTTRKLIKCTAWHLIKHLLADFVNVVLICVSVSWITLQEVSYIGWIVMAVKVSIIAMLCTITTICLFHWKYAAELMRNLRTGKR